MSCEALLFSAIHGEEKGRLKGMVAKGTDNLSIEMKDNKTLLMMTVASVKAGITEPRTFAILKNTEKELTAISYEEPLLKGQTVNVFILNKETGLAIWSKNSTSFFTSKVPDAQIMYLKCY
jgi:hypothetical protein